jgi:hypothetical protein
MGRDQAMNEIRAAYRELRGSASRLERVLQTIADHPTGIFSEKELKRLDKAMTVMKVGFKMVKKVSGATKREVPASRPTKG